MSLTKQKTMEKTLEVEPEIEAILNSHQCPKCGFINNIEVTETHFHAESGVMNGKTYQVVEEITVICQNCGSQYLKKNYW
jgi:ribosomal protein L32